MSGGGLKNLSVESCLVINLIHILVFYVTCFSFLYHTSPPPFSSVLGAILLSLPLTFQLTLLQIPHFCHFNTKNYILASHQLICI